MVSHAVTSFITQISCILSMLGSSAVALTWAYPVINRTKPARILLLWVSIADFFASLFYFLQTFDSIRSDPSLCTILAVLDIFFPVASFIWTDFVALYLYLVIEARLSSSTLNWPRLLVTFHIIAWSVSATVLLVVLLTHHAGGGESAVTGGWCWVKASSNQSLFIWELIGGKLIEWLSAIIITYLYVYVGCTILNIDRNIARIGNNNEENK
ncbi:hypothetical protein EON63_19055, partial [archaeon]